MQPPLPSNRTVFLKFHSKYFIYYQNELNSAGGPNPKNDAKAAGSELIVVKLPEAKKGFVLLPRRWVVERSFTWTSRFRRLAREFERTPETFHSLHFLAFAILMLHNFVKSIAHLL